MKLTHHLRCARLFFVRCSVAILLMSICYGPSAWGQESSTYSIQVEKGPLEAAIGQIRKTTGAVIAFNKADIAALQVPAATYRNLTIEQLLNKLLTGLPLTVQKEGTTYMLLKSASSGEQSKKEPASQKVSGRIIGKIIDEENGQPVVGATMRIGNKGATTDADGSFSITLPEGTYTATISYVGYGTKEVSDVAVKDNQTFELNVTLKRKKGQLATVVVRSSAKNEGIASLYARQKNNAAISDGISAEQIARTPDNNAAQVLKRVSGLTIQDEKFVTVRGLSERYNTVLMNGAVLPSTEPNRRNFAFDIVPSGLIDNIVVHKTATPDMSSEFAGGLVQVNTKDIPVENYNSITLGTGINTNSAGKDMYSTKRGRNDYLGYDDGTKSWWQKNNWDFPKYVQYLRLGDWQNVTSMAKQISNNWGLYRYKYTPVQNYQFSLGRKFGLRNGAEIGITAGVLYRHEDMIETEERRTPAGDQYEYEGNNYVFRSSLGGILNIAYRTKGHKIALKNLYNRLFINESTDYYGEMRGWGADGPLRNYLSITTINDIWHRRLEGEHDLGKRGIKLDWSGDWISAVRDQPDTRNSIGMILSNTSNRKDLYEYPGIRDRTGFLSRGMSIFNSRLKETKYNWSANITIPFTIKGTRQKIKAGYAGTYRDADFESFGLTGTMQNGGDLASDYDDRTFGLPDYKLFGPELLEPGYNYYNDPQVGNNYDGYQRMHAGYLMMDIRFLRRFWFTGGIRAEDNTMFVNSIFFYRGERYPNYTYKKLDWLPSTNLVYALTSKMNLRLSASQTLSRPDFRERAAFIYYDFKSRNEFSGALGLKDAKITNLDFRYEFYPAAGEVLSFSLFHKHFDSPVELIAAQGSGGLRYFYFNLQSSESRGVEIDFRKSLSFINPSSKLLGNIYLSGNTAWMKGNVKYNSIALLDYANEVTQGQEQDIPGEERDRPLQGLSSNIYNAGISYTGKPVGVQVSYNRFGKRIVTAGLYPFQDEYENPRDVIDIQLNTALMKDKLVLRFNVSDLLQQPVVLYNNFNSTSVAINGPPDNPNNDPKGTNYNPDLDYTRYKAKRGMNLSFSATYNF